MPNFLLHKMRIPALLVCSLSLVACTTSNKEVVPNPELEAINANLESLRSGLDEQYSEICEMQQTDLKRDHAELIRDHAELKRDYDANKRNLRASNYKYAELEKSCDTRTVVGKLLMGEIENVLLLNEELTFSARIDTGAETSSLGVYKLQDFERDGKTWVRFKLDDDESSKTYEYRVNGRVKIKQNANTEEDERFEIKMNIGIGAKDYPRQVFNLADRSYLEHQILIGRSFLTDIAIVDTGSKYRLNR